MIKCSDLFHLSFYKKSAYTGSIRGMRFYIEKAQENDDVLFRVWIFPGPFCFEKTADDVKQSKTFPFCEESIAAIADWLNEQYMQSPSDWQQHQSLLPDSE